MAVHAVFVLQTLQHIDEIEEATPATGGARSWNADIDGTTYRHGDEPRDHCRSAGPIRGRRCKSVGQRHAYAPLVRD